ncbi:GerAB/ArcD/ProY family transporter [Clostridium sp. BL8]|nr:GerAB/ArcD/ProY family transporter [Clostridium sp. BL8]
MMYYLMKANNYEDIVVILGNIYGVALGRIISILYAIMMILALGISLRVFSEVITMFLLVNTPTEVILITMIFLGIFLSRGGLVNVVNFNELAFWMIFIPAILAFLLTLPTADFTNLLPVFSTVPVNYFKGSFELLFLLNGFSMAFILIPYVKKKERIGKILRRSSIFIGAFYGVTFILVAATLSVAQTRDTIFPTITMIQSITSRAGFLERWDSLIMAIWVIFYFTAFANTYYFSSYIAKHVFNLKDIKIASVIFLPVVYIAALFPESVVDVRNLKMGFIRMGFIGTLFVVIGITFLLSYIRKGRGVKNEN